MQSVFSAAVVEWSSQLSSTIVNSSGDTLPASDFTFQLGYFDNSFTPTATNTSDWAANWRTFDQAVYNEELGYFTSTVGINGDGSSTSSYAELGLNFAGEQAYVWAYNTQSPGVGTEWFLATASNWVLPQGNDDCCDTTGNVQWSLSDLDNQDAMPVWGAQTGQIGGGTYSVTNSSFDLQTFAAVPEPSGLLLLASATCGLALRRRRSTDSAV